ncbi:GNAT family N-acetyltransferase [Maribacter hydrothermalis]|uniref:Acetyltransferase n=1 Tax=Maribacter hydrothermalis TaxID=1836467 RepID=A0A1B7Z8R4_9FLAO|nr:GNAT family N-acetyltransferase [Maribacter hydrothermalis]APQ18905.1 GNAT family N-acetyltransferase [Maribacter hydrothermalis]OBR39082.1 acetyltransferase [Maribacter hydrothermalis]
MKQNNFISKDISLLNVEEIHQFIANSYWGKGRTLDDVKLTIENSYCFGLYTNENKQIGFARVVTDYIYFGYFMDVIILDKFQGKGYGKILVEAMLADSTIKSLKTLSLKTKDAHHLYERYGFNKIGDSPLWMSIDRQILE